MVLKYVTKNGVRYHEPPYTKEQEAASLTDYNRDRGAATWGKRGVGRRHAFE
jgi:hypothetical protein